MATTPKRLSVNEKGFVIGTIDKTSNRFSVSEIPVLHKTHDAALREATRLLQTSTIPFGRKVVLLKVESFVELNNNPVIVS